MAPGGRQWLTTGYPDIRQGRLYDMQGSGVPMVLCYGYPVSLVEWGNSMPMLGLEYGAIARDALGMGNLDLR